MSTFHLMRTLLVMLFSTCSLVGNCSANPGQAPAGPTASMPPSRGATNGVSALASASREPVLVERLGIRHADQINDFDLATDTMPFHVVTADSVVVHHQRLYSSRLAVHVRGGLDANETRRFRILPGAPLSTHRRRGFVRVVERDEQYESRMPSSRCACQEQSCRRVPWYRVKPCSCGMALGLRHREAAARLSI
jgi:hypothetical protein